MERSLRVRWRTFRGFFLSRNLILYLNLVIFANSFRGNVKWFWILLLPNFKLKVTGYQEFFFVEYAILRPRLFCLVTYISLIPIKSPVIKVLIFSMCPICFLLNIAAPPIDFFLLNVYFAFFKKYFIDLLTRVLATKIVNNIGFKSGL